MQMNTQLPLITVEVTINVPVGPAWKMWTTPRDIMQWNIPFPGWHIPKAENNLKQGRDFFYRMETKDGKEGFDFSGKYDKVALLELIESTLTDGRKSIVKFITRNNQTILLESFEPENKTPLHIQKEFCQAVLNSFKEYAESKG